MKHRVIKVWNPTISDYEFFIQRETQTFTGRHKDWETIVWKATEETAKKNAEHYKVKLVEKESVWDALFVQLGRVCFEVMQRQMAEEEFGK